MPSPPLKVYLSTRRMILFSLLLQCQVGTNLHPCRVRFFRSLFILTTHSCLLPSFCSLSTYLSVSLSVPLSMSPFLTLYLSNYLYVSLSFSFCLSISVFQLPCVCPCHYPLSLAPTRPTSSNQQQQQQQQLLMVHSCLVHTRTPIHRLPVPLVRLQPSV